MKIFSYSTHGKENNTYLNLYDDLLLSERYLFTMAKEFVLSPFKQFWHDLMQAKTTFAGIKIIGRLVKLDII